MRLTLVHDWLTGMRGGEKCLAALCRRFPDARLFTLLRRPGTTCAEIERMGIETSPLDRLPGVHRYYRYLLPLFPWAVERLRLPGDADVVLSLSHAVAKGVIPPRGVPHVCYCFTPMRYAWEARDEYFARPTRSWQRPGALVRNRLLDRVREWDRRTADRVTQFVAISRTVAEQIRRAYGRESSVIYPPVDTEFYTPADAGREDFYLVVSALAPYKRIDRAVEACRRLERKLIVIGSGPERARLESLAGPGTSFLGWRSDEEIRDHHRRCRALLFPGLEDFGIVPLEAQACGAPVIALGQGGATETIIAPTADRPGTGLFFSEPRVEALIGAIESLEAGPERLCPRAARAQAERFSTARYETEMGEMLDKAAKLR